MDYNFYTVKSAISHFYCIRIAIAKWTGGDSMCEKKGDKNMATSTLSERFTLNESAAQKFLTTPQIKLPEINVFNDIKLNHSDRIAHAAKILKRRKWK